MLMRFRRYRVFLIFAVLLTVLIVRFNKSKWPQSSSFASSSQEEQAAKVKPIPWTPRPETEERLVEPQNPAAAEKKEPVVVPRTTPNVVRETTTTTKAAAAKETVPKMSLPERKKPKPVDDVYGGQLDDSEVDDIHPIAPPGRQELEDRPAATSTIHWKSQVEHFPVATGDIIKLPTGTPVSIPKIQHTFDDETSDAKRSREKRQMIVKEEFKKAWGGYKKYAWLHDELSPVSGKFRDPFCGWAATLVDTLDTLWIMGLEEEFEEAAKAVDLIDFTSSPRADIPMFETTIRYLGGLLAAYDVSGGKHKNLLDKAVELADILMGAFDTPNRMPVLYYRWSPAFASQPHRASQRSNLAELGSLSLEFTRLAQITHEPRYYDAVARVTNALSEWQDRGTALGSVFPENVDASGCNRTVDFTLQQPVAAKVPITSTEEEKVLGYQPDSPDAPSEPRKKGVKETPSGPGSLQVQFMPGEPGKAHIKDWDSADKSEKKISKRDVDVEPFDENAAPPTKVVSLGSHLNMAEELPKLNLQPDATSKTEDCKPQGLEPAEAHSYSGLKFGMGGGQDSTYEYYPKQFLLLGGLDTTYRKLYLKTVDDIRKWMLYRPMVPGNRDILFAGSVSTKGDPKNDLKLNAEVEHLTCFIGGMIGMGAKIFGLEGDMEIAKKLTDACVWAYESTSSGIMPESAIVFPCKSPEHCVWNETLWHQELDPIWNERDGNVERYKKMKAEIKAQAAEDAKDAAAKKAAEKLNAQKSGTTADGEGEFISHGNGTAALKKDEPVSLQKRQSESSPKLEQPKPITHNFKDDSTNGKTSSQDSNPQNPDSKAASSDDSSPTEKFLKHKTDTTEEDLASVASGGRQDEHPFTEVLEPPMRDPLMPSTHAEFVSTRIRQESLPPGYTLMKSKKYILRPEAIESVWYMYRITGDTSWQDRGWTMFESIINATSTPYGHSAIMDVTAPRNATYQQDEMESFWLAETLKYFYLLYSTPDVVSLDEWVLNTEAHPFKRPA